MSNILPAKERRSVRITSRITPVEYLAMKAIVESDPDLTDSNFIRNLLKKDKRIIQQIKKLKEGEADE